jgi:uncharacterized protein YggE
MTGVTSPVSGSEKGNSMPKHTPARLTFAASLLAASLAAGACDRSAPHITIAPPAEVERPGGMTVTGSAVLDISPDCADLTMTIVGDGARPGQATAAVQRQQQELVAALEKLGVAGADLKLSYLRLDPVYAQTTLGIQTQRITGYRAEVTVTASTRRFELVSSIMEAGANAGASSMSSQFRRSDLAELKKQVRELALKAAKDKAAQTAKTLGIELGRIVSVAEAPAGAMWGSAYFPQVANEAVSRPASGTLGGALQSLTLDVTIAFELAKKA